MKSLLELPLRPWQDATGRQSQGQRTKRPKLNHKRPAEYCQILLGRSAIFPFSGTQFMTNPACLTDFQWLLSPQAVPWLELAANELVPSVSSVAQLRKELSAERSPFSRSAGGAATPRGTNSPPPSGCFSPHSAWSKRPTKRSPYTKPNGSQSGLVAAARWLISAAESAAT